MPLRSCAAALLFAVMLSSTATVSRVSAQALPLGTEFQVNSVSPGNQDQQEVAADANGNFIVVWTDQDTSLALQRYNSAGGPIGGQTSVSLLGGSDNQASVAMQSNGDALVVWRQDGGLDGDGAGIYARRFLSTGFPTPAEVLINTDTVGDQELPNVIVATSGYLVTWDNAANGSVVGQRLDSTGAPIGTEFQINTYATGAAYASDAVVHPGGNFVVVWDHNYQDGDLSGVFGQRFDSTGAPDGTEFQVNQATYGFQYEATVAGDSAGNFVVVWSSYVGDLYSYNYQADLRARRYDSAGTAQGSEFVITNFRGNTFGYPDIVTDTQDGFVISWTQGCNGYCYSDVFVQRFSSSFSSIGDPIRPHDSSQYAQSQGNLAIDGLGNFIVVWMHDTALFPPGIELIARRFATTSNTPICANGTVTEKAQTKLAKMKPPAGNEKVGFKGRLVFPPDQPALFDPPTQGVQILVEDLGNANAVVYELSHRTIPVPGGTGCAPGDGWTVNASGTTIKYTNESDALPPGCVPGSANGLRAIKIKDRRVQKGYVSVKVKVKEATLPATVVGPLRSTIVIGSDASASAAGDCGAQTTAPEDCSISTNTIKCQ